MNIFILNWRDIKHPLAGGAEQSLMEHAKHWKRRGASVQWFSSQFKGGAARESIDGIEFIRSGSHFTVHLYAFMYFQKHLKNSVDIIVDCFHGIPYFSPLYFNRKKILALINEPAKEVWYKNIVFPLSAIAYSIEPLFFILYNRIPFITSASSISEELKTLGIKNKYIAIIPHGVTILKIKEQKKERMPTIIYLSQLSPDKGIEDAITAFSLIKNKEAIFWVIGKPINKAYFKKLQQLVKDLHITHRVNFLGFVSQQEKCKRLQRAWFLVHPSIREGWGLNVIEANSYGTPAIGYNVTGLRDSIIHNKTGLLTKENSPKGLAYAIEILLDQKRKRALLGKNAKKYASRFTWEQSGRQSWELLSRVYEKSK